MHDLHPGALHLGFVSLSHQLMRSFSWRHLELGPALADPAFLELWSPGAPFALSSC
jgi:hypothetical protein